VVEDDVARFFGQDPPTFPERGDLVVLIEDDRAPASDVADGGVSVLVE
jgi:hypothetical protein